MTSIFSRRHHERPLPHHRPAGLGTRHARGSYTAASLDGDGFIPCSTATQHAAVANAMHRGRTDLVLLLVDAERLTAEVRFEQAAPAGEAFPHLYGLVDLDAVFEATAYRPAADRRFHPHEEAGGFAAHRRGDARCGAATRGRGDGRLSRSLVGGGRMGARLVPWTQDAAHADLEISVLATDQKKQSALPHSRVADAFAGSVSTVP